jgi:hypothetical protein
MQSEYDSIIQNGTWELQHLPAGKRALTTRWIYKIKPGLPGHPPQYKARLVARGYEQRHGMDFWETFAPMVKWETIRLVVAIAAHRRWKIRHLDVQTAFLNSILRDKVYIQQPQGFEQPGAAHLVCRLKQAFYGLRQSPRAWYSCINLALCQKGLTRSQADSNLYFYQRGPHLLILILYMDDLLVTSSDSDLMQQLITSLMVSFA